MKLCIVFIFIIVVFNSVAQASNYLVYFGGGNSKNESDSFFDENLSNVLIYADKNKWNSDYYYRKNLPKNMDEADAKKINHFSEENFNRKILQLKADIKSGKIKPKDQLIIYLDTHGAKKNGQFVVSADDEIFSPEQLRSLATLAEEKDVKLAILGMNCHSGSLLTMANDKTCVITAAPDEKVGFGDFSNGFSYYMNYKNNLESAYLEGRFFTGNKKYIGIQQPYISSPAGIATQELLEEVKNSLTDEHDIEAFLLGSNNCKNFSTGLDQVKEKIKFLKKISNKSLTEKLIRKHENLFSALKIQLEKYAELSEQAIQIRKEYAATFSSKDSEMAKKDQESMVSQLSTKIAALQELGKKISINEKKIYNLLYKDLSSQIKGPNPCRDFKL